MYKLQRFSTYLTEGFFLVNRTPQVVAISMLFSLLSLATPQFGFLLNILIIYPLFAYSLSTPLFLSLKQENKNLSFQFIGKTTFENTKRILIPGTLIALGIALLMVVLLYASVLLLVLPKGQLEGLTTPGSPIYTFVILGMLILFSPLTFTGIFFSLKKIGLFSSLKKSVGLYVKTFDFMVVLILLHFAAYILLLVVPTKEIWEKGIHSLILTYKDLILGAVTLLFFKKEVEK